MHKLDKCLIFTDGLKLFYSVIHCDAVLLQNYLVLFMFTFKLIIFKAFEDPYYLKFGYSALIRSILEDSSVMHFKLSLCSRWSYSFNSEKIFYLRLRRFHWRRTMYVYILPFNESRLLTILGRFLMYSL